MIKPYRKHYRRGFVTPSSTRKSVYAGPSLSMTGQGAQHLSLIPEEHSRLYRRVGRQRAKRIVELLAKYPREITIPEAIAYAWLEDHRYRFQFQSSMLGGLHIRGGAVVDFLIYDASHEGLYAWRVQGEHWHGTPRKEVSDGLQAARIMGIKIGGEPIVAVVDLWEDDLYDRWPEVLELGIAGVNMRHALN